MLDNFRIYIIIISTIWDCSFSNFTASFFGKTSAHFEISVHLPAQVICAVQPHLKPGVLVNPGVV